MLLSPCMMALAAASLGMVKSMTPPLTRAMQSPRSTAITCGVTAAPRALTPLEQCLVDADGEVEVERCMSSLAPISKVGRLPKAPKARPSHSATLELTSLEACLVDADGEVEAEACLAHFGI